MRLIDADKLLESMSSCTFETSDNTMRRAEHIVKAHICDLIHRQPTAYDVDKVVEQLKAEGICGKCLNNCNPTSICATFCDMGQRLEIVKEGGVNE